MAYILISEFMPEDAVARLQASHNVTYSADLFQQQEQLLHQARRAEAIVVRNKTQVDGKLLEAATNLQAVGRLGVGLDNIDLDACRSRGVEVYTAAGANAISVAEYVVASALQLRRRQCWQYSARVAAGEWPRNQAVGNELADCCVGLLGFGQIARVTASRFQAFGVRLLAHDPQLSPDDSAWQLAERVDFSTLLQSSDILSLHVPLLASTRNIINSANIDSLKEGAIVINSARGGLLDECALAAALRSGHLSGAALDVFTDEPLSEEQMRAFSGLDNLLLSPHVAGLTEQSNARVGHLIADRILQHFTS